MSKFNLLSFVIFIYLIISQLSITESRPHTQKIVVHGHEWTVPNEEGWQQGKIKLLIFNICIFFFFVF